MENNYMYHITDSARHVSRKFLWSIGLHELRFRHKLGVRQDYYNCLGLLKHTTLFSLDNFPNNLQAMAI